MKLFRPMTRGAPVMALAMMTLLCVSRPASATLTNIFNLHTADNYAVLSYGDQDVSLNGGNVTGPTGLTGMWVTGNVGIGPGGKFSQTAGTTQGTVYLYPTATGTQSGGSTVITGGIVTDVPPSTTIEDAIHQSLVDATAASHEIAGLDPTQTLSAITNVDLTTISTTFRPDGGVNVISIPSITLQSGQKIVIDGGPNDIFYINVGNVTLNGANIEVTGGVDYRNVIINMPGTGDVFKTSNKAVIWGTVLNPADNTLLGDEIGLNNGFVVGNVVGGKITIASGSQVLASPPYDPPDPPVVPEGGSLAMLAMGLLPLVGGALRLRR